MLTRYQEMKLTPEGLTSDVCLMLSFCQVPVGFN